MPRWWWSASVCSGHPWCRPCSPSDDPAGRTAVRRPALLPGRQRAHGANEPKQTNPGGMALDRACAGPRWSRAGGSRTTPSDRNSTLGYLTLPTKPRPGTTSGWTNNPGSGQSSLGEAIVRVLPTARCPTPTRCLIAGAVPHQLASRQGSVLTAEQRFTQVERSSKAAAKRWRRSRASSPPVRYGDPAPPVNELDEDEGGEPAMASHEVSGDRGVHADVR